VFEDGINTLPQSDLLCIYIRCEGRTTCSLTANDATFGGSDPCPDTGKYLKIIYLCVPGEKHCDYFYTVNKKYVLWNVYLPNVVAFHIPLSKYLTVIVMTLTRSVQGHPTSKIMVPIESPWVVSYLTSFEFNIVSLTVFETFDIKDIFP